MAQAARKAEVFEFPSGGIADFYMEDDEIAALEREEAKEQFGNNGIANFSDVANRMASYGRYGDDTVAHVETGELVIPKALIDENPKLRDSIFQHLEDLGVEDPERYVVGSGANSINPDTGLPEFFLNKFFRGVKKTVSKIGKGVKKAFKSVAKVVKKAAPLIIPLVLNYAFPGMGAIYQGALGAGIGTLVQGGSLKDAFKSALIGGALGGAMEGVKGGYKAAKAGGDFNAISKGAFDGIKGAAKLSNLSEAGQQLITGQFGQSGLEAVRKSALDVTTAGGIEAVKSGAGLELTGNQTTDAIIEEANQPGLQPLETTASSGKFATDGTFTGADAGAEFIQSPDASKVYSAESLATTPPEFMTKVDTSAVVGDGILDRFKDYSTKAGDILFRGGKDAETLARAASQAKQEAIQNTLLELGHQGPLATAPATIASEAIAAGKAAAAGAAPGMLATYGPSLALAGTAAYAGGFFDKPEDDPPPDPPPPIKQGPEYMVGGLDPRGSTGPIVVGTDYGIDPRTGRPYVNPFRRPSYGLPVLAVAEGGEIFPRRVGGIMPDEGTPGKDSVRAMLMPGEFVMTTNAVKGLGDGDNDKGINRMYDMMRGLEAKGRAMA